MATMARRCSCQVLGPEQKWGAQGTLFPGTLLPGISHPPLPVLTHGLPAVDTHTHTVIQTDIYMHARRHMNTSGHTYARDTYARDTCILGDT